MANKQGRTYEVPDMVGMASRVMRGMTRRAAEGDREALPGLAAMRDEAERQLREAALALHAKGNSWAVIGGELGMTRQAAQQRFGR